MEPAEESLPAAPPAGTKSALAFTGLLLALLLPALLAQHESPVLGLAATQLAVFLLPALAATAGSNLRVTPYLRLGRVRPGLILLGALAGTAGYVTGGAVMAIAQRLLPRAWVETFDVARLFEAPTWERWSLAALAALAAPVCEELTFRGYVQTTLSLRRRPAIAIAVGAILFATIHLDPVRLPALLVLGTTFGWLTWRAGSIWPSVAAHATNNGIAAALLLTIGPPEREAAPTPAQLAGTLAFGAVALALLLARFRAATPVPPPATDALSLVDPASPSLEWRASRVPAPLALAALAGLASLLLLALAGLTRGR
ncbi:MAG TPA: type II CAAX endopeptidase family protein [Anaeromyxobacter sp.]